MYITSMVFVSIGDRRQQLRFVVLCCVVSVI
ncbi:MAG: hypothetical protein ACI90V_002830, partial [Bacillariaceae sp.]